MADLLSSITLCNVPITPLHQLDFPQTRNVENKATKLSMQKNYFNEHAVHTYTNCRYIARDGLLKVSGYVDDLANCNYGFYENTYNSTSKTFYFWIIQKNLASKNTVELTIAIDEFQTWLFDFTLNDCLIEREHVKNDGIGKHTYPENFELGEYVTMQREEVTQLQGQLAYIIAYAGENGVRIGKNYSALRYEVYYSTNALNNLIRNFNDDGKIDCIAYIFTFPIRAFNLMFKNRFQNDGSIITNISENDFMLNEVIQSAINSNASFPSNHGYDSYIPKNNKLYTYPYTFISVKTPNGSNTVLKFENFFLGDSGFTAIPITFSLFSTLSPNPVFELVPLRYCKRATSYEDATSLQGFGLCSWINDNYATWYAQHENSIKAQSKNAQASYLTSNTTMQNDYDTRKDVANRNLVREGINSSLSTVGALGNLQFGSALQGGASGVNNMSANYDIANMQNNNDIANRRMLNDTNYFNTMRSLVASVQDASIQPNNCKGDTTVGGLDVARDTNTFFVSRETIESEYAERIDMFFQMFGYQVNRIGRPQFTSRLYWNYLKTTGVNVTGTIPLEDRNAIADMFDNGLTIWHLDSMMFNYSANNQIDN